MKKKQIELNIIYEIVLDRPIFCHLLRFDPQTFAFIFFFIHCIPLFLEYSGAAAGRLTAAKNV